MPHVNTELQKRLVGEAKFFVVTYWILARNFGGLPLMNRRSALLIDKGITRSSSRTIYAQVGERLKDAIEVQVPELRYLV